MAEGIKVRRGRMKISEGFANVIAAIIGGIAGVIGVAVLLAGYGVVIAIPVLVVVLILRWFGIV